MKLKSIYLGVFVFAVITLIGTSIRLFPLRNFQPNDSTERASLYVIGQLRQHVTEQVNKANPDLPAEQKEVLIRKFLNDILRKDKDHFKDAIEKISESSYNDSRHSKAFPYLLASDSYYFYDLTQKLVEDGRYSDTFKGSKFLYKEMMAPTGHWEPITWHPYLGLAVYKVIKVFWQEVPVMFAVGTASLFTSALCLLPFLYICRKIGCSWLITLIAGIFFNLAPIFVKRSTFAWFDNDAYNIFFPLLIFALLYKAFCEVFSWRKTIIYGLIIGTIIFIYAHFWQGWVFLLGALLVSCVVRLIYEFLPVNKGIPEGKYLWGLWATVFFGSFFITTLFFGPGEFFTLFKEGWKALSEFMTPQLSTWPDLYLSVGELQRTSFAELVNMTGGVFFFVIALIGFGRAIILALKKSPAANPNWVIIISSYFAITLILSTSAQRFFLLLLSPLGIGFAYGLNFLNHLLQNVIQNRFSKNNHQLKMASICCVVLLLSLAVIPWLRINKQILRLLNPIYNETWDKALAQAREKTPPDAIINAWWPPGHFIKATAHRRVTFDGASINYPQSYWLINFFAQTDEKNALGIIRMLNDSGNAAADYLLSQGMDIVTTVSLLKEITKLDEFRARMVLNVVLKDEQKVAHLLSLTHAAPPPSYILIYNEFVENNIELRFVGNWNFKEIADINQDPARFAKVPARNSRAYIDFLWNLAGGPNKYSGILPMINKKGETILFEHELTVNAISHEAYIRSPKYGEGVPKSIFYLENNRVIEKDLNGNLNYSVVFLADKHKTYQALLMDQSLAQSMLMQMYFFDAKGLQYIEPFISESDLTHRTTIKIFKINWDKFSNDLSLR